VETAKPLRI